MALCVQWQRCGTPGCRCARGQLHGPYYALLWREDGRLRKRYVRLADVEQVRAAVAAERQRRRDARALATTWGERWRAALDRVTGVTGDG